VPRNRPALATWFRPGLKLTLGPAESPRLPQLWPPSTPSEPSPTCKLNSDLTFELSDLIKTTDNRRATAVATLTTSPTRPQSRKQALPFHRPLTH
jgi:hypothetical protein